MWRMGTPCLARHSLSCARCSFLGRKTLAPLQDQAESDQLTSPATVHSLCLLLGVRLPQTYAHLSIGYNIACGPSLPWAQACLPRVEGGIEKGGHPAHPSLSPSKDMLFPSLYYLPHKTGAIVVHTLLGASGFCGHFLEQACQSCSPWATCDPQ